jgi:hypothetical protein
VTKKANGASCAAGNECASGSCTDGVCCTTSSCPACQSCNVNGAGTCANVANDTADPPNCAANGACGNTGLCVAGACQQQPASTACGLPQACNGTTYQPPSFCSGTGACTQTATSDCGAYQCGASACKTTCAGDGDCTAGNYCAGTSCVAKHGLGTACGGANQCVSGNCTDGVCCTTSSCPTCQSCSAAGTGVCANVPDGSGDPGSCGANGVCGNTGACVGGTCQQQSGSVTCGAAVSCVGNTYQPPSFCNGSGSCSQVGTTSCGRFVCNAAGTACLVTCNSNTDCVDGNYCTGVNGSCEPKKGLGAGCGTGNECGSGNCVEGVCCNVASCGACQTCAGGAPGTCTAVADGQADGRCTVSLPCGQTGFCAGGACALAASGAMCSGFGCVDATTFQPGGGCNGSGTCSVPGPVNCAPLKCELGGCRPTCSADAHCIDGYYCNGSGGCSLKQGPGSTCGRNEECSSGHCTQGVCCDLGQCPACQSCVIPGSVGTCTNVAADQPDPQLMCPDQGPATCGTNGKCNGAGNCQRYDTSTECARSCDGTNVTHTFCDVSGLCSGLSILELCPSLTCDPNGCLL